MLFSLWILSEPCAAAPLNIVNVSEISPIKLSFEVEGKSVAFEVESGKSSGFFFPPETTNKFIPKREEVPPLEVPAGEGRNFAILHTNGDEFLWKIVPVKPADGGWSFKIINLSGDELKFTFGGGEETIEAGKELEVPVTEKAEIRVIIPDLLDAKYEKKEATAVVALVYKFDGELKTIFLE